MLSKIVSFVLLFNRFWEGSSPETPAVLQNMLLLIPNSWSHIILTMLQCYNSAVSLLSSTCHPHRSLTIVIEDRASLVSISETTFETHQMEKQARDGIFLPIS